MAGQQGWEQAGAPCSRIVSSWLPALWAPSPFLPGFPAQVEEEGSDHLYFLRNQEKPSTLVPPELSGFEPGGEGLVYCLSISIVLFVWETGSSDIQLQNQENEGANSRC